MRRSSYSRSNISNGPRSRIQSESIKEQDFTVSKHDVPRFKDKEVSDEPKEDSLFMRQFLMGVEILRLNKNLRKMDKHVMDAQNEVKMVNKKNKKLQDMAEILKSNQSIAMS